MSKKVLCNFRYDPDSGGPVCGACGFPFGKCINLVKENNKSYVFILEKINSAKQRIKVLEKELEEEEKRISKL